MHRTVGKPKMRTIIWYQAENNTPTSLSLSLSLYIYIYIYMLRQFPYDMYRLDYDIMMITSVSNTELWYYLCFEPGHTLEQRMGLQVRLETPWYALLHGIWFNKRSRSISCLHYGSLTPIQWCHDWRDGVLKHRRLDCLLSSLFMRRSYNTSKIHVARLC